MNNNLVEVLAEVKSAVETGKPVVALESTVIAHGKLLVYLQ